MTNKELDKWIAENVMGWTIKITDGEEFIEIASKSRTAIALFKANKWKPTESISDAFQVVEKLTQDGTQVEIGNNYMDEKSWYCVFGINLEYINQASILPLAICLAAKKAFEADSKDGGEKCER